MRRNALIITALAALATGGAAVASEIYKWTDSDGNLHYGDRPTSEARVERLAIASRNTDNAAVQDRLQARAEVRAAAEQAAADAPKEKTREELRAEREKRQERCQQYRDKLDTFNRSQRLYRQDESGEREYLEEDEILAARTRVEQQIDENCG